MTEKANKNHTETVIKTTENVFADHKEEKTYYDSSDMESLSTDSYDEALEWTPEEEQRVRNKLDLKLMTFMLVMTFVLNMDRTNICKYMAYFNAGNPLRYTKIYKQQMLFQTIWQLRSVLQMMVSTLLFSSTL
ncbi:hypothetical protein [Parasitella parasitica]|uniref:Major facilitator superfamily (MFS) profile domain-containing protein n=1 Tax=Parasitella parasitica TaxID=35722 RepID=A0A0B7N6F6_9FUNG|nr:hypothetical protein [Parasitella parasitica]